MRVVTCIHAHDGNIANIFFICCCFFYYRPCDGTLTPTSKKQPPMTSVQQLFFNKKYIKLDLIKYKQNSKSSYVGVSYFRGYFISALENSKNKNKFVFFAFIIIYWYKPKYQYLPWEIVIYHLFKLHQFYFYYIFILYNHFRTGFLLNVLGIFNNFIQRLFVHIEQFLKNKRTIIIYYFYRSWSW